MSESLINQITLDCLINKEQYAKYVSNTIHKNINKKDKRFYKKRISSLTKELLSSQEEGAPKNLFPDVQYAFDNYVKACINYFKVLDRNDIIQDEYKDYNEDVNNTIVSEESIKTLEENDKLLMRSIKIAHSLDNFIKTSVLKNKADDIVLPKQKNINLRDPVLRNKGICKKKNITNKYDDENKIEKE